jgi:tetratricopeptide (TPR) repeat protein
MVDPTGYIGRSLFVRCVGDLSEIGSFQLNEGLDDLLLPYRLALEKISQAEERLNAGEAQQAIELLTDLEDKSPSFPIIDYWLGKAFDDQGRRESAAQHFQKFIESCTPYDALSRDRIAEAKAFLQKNT